MFILNRARLTKLLPPGSLAVLHANDILPTNADGSLRLRQNSDLFYLTGVDQEETILLLCPGRGRREAAGDSVPARNHDLIATWEGHKLTKEEARRPRASNASNGWRNSARCSTG